MPRWVSIVLFAVLWIRAPGSAAQEVQLRHQERSTFARATMFGHTSTHLESARTFGPFTSVLDEQEAWCGLGPSYPCVTAQAAVQHVSTVAGDSISARSKIRADGQSFEYLSGNSESRTDVLVRFVTPVPTAFRLSWVLRSSAVGGAIAWGSASVTCTLIGPEGMVVWSAGSSCLSLVPTHPGACTDADSSMSTGILVPGDYVLEIYSQGRANATWGETATAFSSFEVTLVPEFPIVSARPASWTSVKSLYRAP